MHQHERLGRIRPFSARAAFLALLLLAFGCGWLYADLRAPRQPEMPEWMTAAPGRSQPGAYAGRNETAASGVPQNNAALWAAADNAGETPEASASRPAVRLRARVHSVQGRAEGNLRLILEDLRPAEGAPADAFAGRAIFTWREPPTPEGGRPSKAEKAVARAGFRLPRRPVAGDTLEMDLRLREIHGLSNPGLWNVEDYWAGRGVWLRAWAEGDAPRAELKATEGFGGPSLWRERLRLKTLAALPLDEQGALRPGAELIPALLFGDQYLVRHSDLELVSRSTLAHSLALSGLHLGYAAALGYLAVRLLYRLRPRLAERLPRTKAAVLAGMVPALFYLWLGASAYSLLRSFLMLAFIGFLFFRNRRPQLMDALCAVLGVITLAGPEALFELSLQLSAACIAVISLALPLNRALLARLGAMFRKRRPAEGYAEFYPPPPGRGQKLFYTAARGLGMLLLTSLSIQLALAPLLIKSFGFFGLALPLNLIWLPVLGFLALPLCFAGLAAAALQLEGLAQALFYLASLPCGGLLQGLGMLDASGLLPVLHPPRPHWLTMLGYWFLLSLLPRLFTRPPGPKAGEKRGLNKSLACALCCGLVLLLSPTVWRLHDNTRDVLRLRLLDVGHGQAVLLEWQGGRRLLLDGGGGSFSSGFDLGREVIAATLADNRLPRLDYMLASHLDADHAQGLLFPLRHLRVDYYADNGQAPDRAFSRELVRLLDESGLPRNRLQAGDVLRLSRDLRLEFLHPAPGQTYKGKNNDASLVARLVWRGHGLALLCGDVEKSGQRSMLRPGRAAAAKDEPAPKEFAAYTLILPHHGSAGALLPDLYQAAAPRLALASAARHSPWNLPAPKVKNALRELGIPLLSTARCGQITLEWSDPQNPPRVHAARLGYLEQ